MEMPAFANRATSCAGVIAPSISGIARSRLPDISDQMVAKANATVPLAQYLATYATPRVYVPNGEPLPGLFVDTTALAFYFIHFGALHLAPACCKLRRRSQASRSLIDCLSSEFAGSGGDFRCSIRYFAIARFSSICHVPRLISVRSCCRLS